MVSAHDAAARRGRGLRGRDSPNELREYQAKARDIVLRDLISGATRAGYVELPTGGGKTRLAVAIAIEIADRLRILVLVPSTEIAEQTVNAYAIAFGAENVGRCYGGAAELDRDVTIATPASLKNARLRAYVGAGLPILAIADEAHHVAPGTLYARAIEAVLGAHTDARALGLTATPFRHDGKSIGLGRCLFSRSIEDLQAVGVLVPMESNLIEIDELRLADVATRAGDFQAGELAAMLREVTDTVVHHTGELLRGRIALAFGASIAHAQELAGAFARAGFRTGFVFGEQAAIERRVILDRWRKRKLDLVVNVGCLLEGFDFPEIDALLIARPTQSPGLYLQMIGRGLRTAPGKRSCLVVDIAGNESPERKRQILLRDLVRTRSADGRGIADSARVGGAKLRLHREREREFDLAWVENAGDEGLMIGYGTAVIACVDRDAGLYGAAYSTNREITMIGEPTSHSQAFSDVLAFAHEHLHDSRVWRRDAAWRLDCASDKQRAHMERLGLPNFDNPEITKGEAADAIASHSVQRVAGILRRRKAPAFRPRKSAKGHP
jgi:superfamily II DNA or RNA helicase